MVRKAPCNKVFAREAPQQLSPCKRNSLAPAIKNMISHLISHNMKVLALIPSRFASTRFPGKPLVLLADRPIVQHVYERVVQLFPDTYVATDDKRIFSCVESFGGRAIMTSPHHQSGTDRCREAYEQLGETFDVVLNVQGDEPFVDDSQLQSLVSCFEEKDTQIATLIKAYHSEQTYEQLSNPNQPKVIVNEKGRALYFSRSVIPYLRGVAPEQWLRSETKFYHHIGLYGYRPEVLVEITELPPSPLEKAESLEQLRWLEAGYSIQTALTMNENIGIDTPEDLVKAEALLRK